MAGRRPRLAGRRHERGRHVVRKERINVPELTGLTSAADPEDDVISVMEPITPSPIEVLVETGFERFQRRGWIPTPRRLCER